MPTALTANACAAFKDDGNYAVCVTEPRPVLRVENVERCVETQLFGFTKGATAKLCDGTDSVFVLLPTDYKIYGTGAEFDGRTLSAGDVIRIKQMVRLPSGENRATQIMVCSMELCDGDDAEPEAEAEQAAENL